MLNKINALGSKIGKIRQVGLLNAIKGCCKVMYFTLLKKRYRFARWHLSPIEHRKYAMDIVEAVQSLSAAGASIAEVGCGLGEILRKISVSGNPPEARLFGWDISPEVIAAAEALDKKNEITYSIGTFDDVRDMKIDWLITVNFLHNISSGDLAEYYRKITEQNDIERIVADTVSGSGYKYHHDLLNIMPDAYKLESQSNLYSAERRVMVFRKSSKEI